MPRRHISQLIFQMKRSDEEGITCKKCTGTVNKFSNDRKRCADETKRRSHRNQEVIQGWTMNFFLQMKQRVE